jgi:thiamine pyrophosphokinase
MKVNRLLIICNGDIPKRKIIFKILKEIDFIICADGGANHASKLDITPDLIIGDMDSISAKTQIRFKKIKTIKIDDQNSTDLEKALTHALTLKPEFVYITAAFGDRIDHSLTNLSILRKYNNKLNIEIITNNNILRLISKPIEFNGKIGDTISLVPLGKVSRIKTQGLKYPLNNEELEFGIREGQSNEIISNPVKIDFKKGELFVITDV